MKQPIFGFKIVLYKQNNLSLVHCLFYLAYPSCLIPFIFISVISLCCPTPFVSFHVASHLLLPNCDPLLQTPWSVNVQ
jgi:hypothetical protein